MKLLKQFRMNTSASTDFHKTFQFITENQKTKDLSNFQGKWSNLKGVKLQDCDLRKNVSMEVLEGIVQHRLEAIDKEERYVSRLIEKSEFISKQNAGHRTVSNLHPRSRVSKPGPISVENDFSPEIQHQKTHRSPSLGQTKETLVRKMRTMVGDAEFDKTASEIKSINGEHKLSSERFATVVRYRHKGFEKQWEGMPRIKELHLKANRKHIATKSLIFEDLKKFN